MTRSSAPLLRPPLSKRNVPTFFFKYERPKDVKGFNGNSPLRVGGSNAEAGVPAINYDDGSPRHILVLLVEFKDIKFNQNHGVDEIKTQMCNKVEKYFKDQSNSKYTPKFDLFGIYSLSNNRDYYGDNGDQGKGADIRIGDMVTEAVNLATPDISASADRTFNDYDTNNDGYCDAVIIIYAGTGEAFTYPNIQTNIWPKRWTLNGAKIKGYGGDGEFRPSPSAPLINEFAVFNELGGSDDNGSQIAGIGVFCHEFSHSLGLPDFYDVDYNKDEQGRDKYFHMGRWSIMGSGGSNGSDVSSSFPSGNNGNTPIGYNAYEKKFMGWIDYIYAEPGTYYTLPVWNKGSETSDKAVCIYSELNQNEYFIYENRKKQGWDRYIADEGIMITHVSYDPDRWTRNKVNNQETQLMTILPADNKLTLDSQDRDLWPKGSNTAVTDNSAPSATLFLDSNGNVTGNAGKLGKPVTDMVINSDGSASFWYMKGHAQTLTVNPPTVNFNHVKYGSPKTLPVTITGMGLEQLHETLELKIVGPDASQFRVNTTSVSVGPVCNGGYTINVTYTPPISFNPSVIQQTAKLMISGEHTVLKSVDLMAKPSIFGDEDGDGSFDIADLSAVIDYLLQGQDSPYSGQLSIDILSAYIDYLLNGETSIDLDGGLVAYYPLDGNTQDMSGHGNHGVATNVTAIQGITSVQGTAYRFGGTDSPSYIRVPNSSSLQFSDGFTFSCFVKPMDWRGMNGSGAVVDHGSHCIFAKSSDQTGPAMMFSGEDDGLHVWCGSVNSQNQWANIGSSEFMSNGDFLNKWVHVAVTYSASKRKARLFVNGNLINEKFLTVPVDYSQMNASDLYLGRFRTSSWWNPMNGALDEVRIYNRALNLPEVKELSSEFITDAQVGLSESVVVMAVGEEVRVNIKNGCGNYSVGSVPDVVDCRLEGETIVLTGMGEGTTNVTFNDIDSHIHILLPVTVVRSAVTYTVNGVSFTMMPVLGGTFTMGATEEQGSEAADNEKPPHLVTLSSYSIGQTEVTQELWQAVMGSNPSMYTGDLQRPVERVSWDDCQTFITKLNTLTGLNFRLPTEAEWEYAARGGAMSLHYKYAGSNTLSEVAWWGFGYDDNSTSGNSGFTTHPVATKLPNELNLYDMSGNVLEWCSDWLGLYTSAALVNPTGIESGTSRVSRGGAWGNAAANCRVSYRIGNLPNNRNPALGLRLAL